MFWQDDDQSKKDVQIGQDWVDLLFSIECKELPVDHAYSLSAELYKAAPWLKQEQQIGVHNIHLAGSQNGWERPDSALGQRLILSRRTKMVLRVPKGRCEQIQQELEGKTLQIEDCSLIIGKSKVRPLSKQGTIFSRQIILEDGEDQDENLFLQRIVKDLDQRGIRVRKALCGMTQPLDTPDGPILTRSIMLANLSAQESIQLQQEGFGPGRHMGCGIFIPHKGIDAVNKSEDE